MRNLFFYFILILIFCSLSGCQQSNSAQFQECLEISLPAWPAEQEGLSQSYPPLSRWKITISSASSQTIVFTDKAIIAVPVKKNRPLCITAAPLTLLQDGSECSYFKPAGYIYPSEASSASWEEGFIAATMEKLFQETINEGLSPLESEYLISTFNWKKAQASIEKKISSDSQTFYNPWLLSQSAIIDGICSQNFKASLLNPTGFVSMDCTALQLDSNWPLLSSFVPENNNFIQKKQFTVIKNTPILIADAKKYGLFITYKSSKNISLEYIYLPIYIEDV